MARHPKKKAQCEAVISLCSCRSQLVKFGSVVTMTDPKAVESSCRSQLVKFPFVFMMTDPRAVGSLVHLQHIHYAILRVE